MAGEAGAEHAEEVPHLSHAAELGLMGFSVMLALAGIFLARRNYEQEPEVAEQWATSFAGPHRVLTNKYYVDEFYEATVVAGTMSSARGLFAVDRRVVDGAVNGTGWVTIVSSWVSHVIDKYVVDGIVNLVGEHGPRSQLQLPPCPNWIDSKLRVRDAGWSLRVRDLVSDWFLAQDND